MTMPKGWKQSNELDARLKRLSDSKEPELELKKWLVERIGHELQAYRNSLSSQKDKSDIFNESWKSNLTNLRNSIMSVIALIITSVIGLAPLLSIISSFLVPLISVAVAVALISFITINIWKYFATRLLNQIDIAFISTMEGLEVVHGYITAASFDLDLISTRQLYDLAQFTKILGQSRILLFDPFESASRSILFYSNKAYFSQNSNFAISATMIAYDIYSRREYVKNQNFLKPIWFLLTLFLSRQSEITRIFQARRSLE